MTRGGRARSGEGSAELYYLRTLFTEQRYMLNLKKMAVSSYNNNNNNNNNNQLYLTRVTRDSTSTE